MAEKFDCELAKFSKKLIEEMFQVKPGETVAITADSGSNNEVVDALVRAAYVAGGKPLILWAPRAREDGQAGLTDQPAEALTAALCEVDIWIEANSRIILYSDIWETALRENKKLRYLIIGDTSVQALGRVIGSVDVKLLGELLRKVKSIISKAETIKVTSEKGTDVAFKTDLNHIIEFCDGDFSKPVFGTPPGYVNVVPKFGSMEGKIVFDRLLPVDLVDEDRVEFVMEHGKIIEFNGGKKAKQVKNYVEGFNDQNMFKISHMMVGLNPGVREFSGEIVEDERIWGGVDFGFGHTSPIDAPPEGQPAKSHFDGMLADVSIWIDDIQLFDNGKVCHPELESIAESLIK